MKVFGECESGQIRILDEHDIVTISLHWPFDRETDEWIDASGDFHRSVLEVDGAGSSIEAGDQETGSRLTLQETKDGRYRLFLRGRNTVSPVQADIFIDDIPGRQLFEELASLAGR